MTAQLDPFAALAALAGAAPMPPDAYGEVFAVEAGSSLYGPFVERELATAWAERELTSAPSWSVRPVRVPVS